MYDSSTFQANNSLHSMLFSKSFRHPNKRIFYILVCRVILGYGLKLPAKEVASSAFQPRNPRELKYIPEVNSPVFYNSLFVDRTRDHGFNEIVIFHSDQTFPEYLLAFTRDWMRINTPLFYSSVVWSPNLGVWESGSVTWCLIGLFRPDLTLQYVRDRYKCASRFLIIYSWYFIFSDNLS